MLSDLQQRVLAFEGTHSFRHSGTREGAVGREFGMSLTRYVQVLEQAIDDPDALAADPMLVKRLLNARAQRLGRRASRRYTSVR